MPFPDCISWQRLNSGRPTRKKDLWVVASATTLKVGAEAPSFALTHLRKPSRSLGVQPPAC